MTFVYANHPEAAEFVLAANDALAALGHMYRVVPHDDATRIAGYAAHIFSWSVITDRDREPYDRALDAMCALRLQLRRLAVKAL